MGGGFGSNNPMAGMAGPLGNEAANATTAQPNVTATNFTTSVPVVTSIVTTTPATTGAARSSHAGVLHPLASGGLSVLLAVATAAVMMA
ncbi:Aste57867_7422 [Aphanomyces stellatus]|nr:hypothetical protein As57867_007396 [Aphanomyces stellatus]KAF0711364.1 hypothetical protein As57867_005298 [Aphanomyces stellatus]VFT82377.1 Aste57867_5311 [Aphanomyces stellatus]VFT84335.1 Aste57867_7422 [Aphanomyces stellatus]